MSSAEAARHQDQRGQTAANCPQNANGRDSRPQGTAPAARQIPGEYNADTPFVPIPKRKKKKNPLDFSKPNPEFVNIFIGSFNSQPFKIHLDVIIAYSPYFKTAFANNEFQEGRTKSMRLKDVDEKVFGIFNNWLYKPNGLRAEDATELGLLLVAKLWTAAAFSRGRSSKIRKPPTQTSDNALNQFLVHAYSAKEETQLKKLAVQKMIRVLPSVISLKDWAAEFPNGLMIDISEALMKHHQSLPGGLRNPTFVVKDYMLPEEE
ncbi:hypothetical protein F5882DRAFT_502403 [Hyaloscypha sp. PMI_1271]|nr:hypothetical protein F5882DRAFT_502403 [Hyaloscypha sp. PMI_1271]